MTWSTKVDSNKEQLRAIVVKHFGLDMVLNNKHPTSEKMTKPSLLATVSIEIDQVVGYVTDMKETKDIVRYVWNSIRREMLGDE